MSDQSFLYIFIASFLLFSTFTSTAEGSQLVAYVAICVASMISFTLTHVRRRSGHQVVRLRERKLLESSSGPEGRSMKGEAAVRISSRQPYRLTFYLACDKFRAHNLMKKSGRVECYRRTRHKRSTFMHSHSLASCPSCDNKKVLRK